MNKQEIYDKIVDWQMEAGEDFLDYFDSDLNIPNYMFWCLGKGYITADRFHNWEIAMKRGDYEAEWATSVVHSCHGDEDTKGYAVVWEEDWTEEGQEKAYGYLAEFMSESLTYQRRLQRFLEEN